MDLAVSKQFKYPLCDTLTQLDSPNLNSYRKKRKSKRDRSR
jgi:hypothetical protein